jgi:hypothetical protein
MSDFDRAWGGLTQALRPRQTLSGWSRDKGITSLKFQIAEIDSTSVTVIPGQGKRRRISKGDFAQVFAFWPEYLRGDLPRHAMANISQNTSYIFGILHWYETSEVGTK